MDFKPHMPRAWPQLNATQVRKKEAFLKRLRSQRTTRKRAQAGRPNGNLQCEYRSYLARSLALAPHDALKGDGLTRPPALWTATVGM